MCLGSHKGVDGQDEERKRITSDMQHNKEEQWRQCLATGCTNSQSHYIVYFVPISCITLVRVPAVGSELSKNCTVFITKYAIPYTFLYYSVSVFYLLTVPILDHLLITFLKNWVKKYQRRRLTSLPLTNIQKFVCCQTQTLNSYKIINSIRSCILNNAATEIIPIFTATEPP